MTARFAHVKARFTHVTARFTHVTARFAHVKVRFAHCAEGRGGGAELSPATARDSCQKRRPGPQSGSRCSHEAAETGTGKAAGEPGEEGANWKKLRKSESLVHTLRQTRIGSYPEKWGKNQARSWKPKVPRPSESWEEPGLLPARATSPQSFRGEPAGPRLGRGVECSCGKSWFRPALTKFKTSSATAARKAPEKCSSLPDKTPPQTRKVWERPQPDESPQLGLPAGSGAKSPPRGAGHAAAVPGEAAGPEGSRAAALPGENAPGARASVTPSTPRTSPSRRLLAFPVFTSSFCLMPLCLSPR